MLLFCQVFPESLTFKLWCTSPAFNGAQLKDLHLSVLVNSCLLGVFPDNPFNIVGNINMTWTWWSCHRMLHKECTTRKEVLNLGWDLNNLVFNLFFLLFTKCIINILKVTAAAVKLYILSSLSPQSWEFRTFSRGIFCKSPRSQCWLMSCRCRTHWRDSYSLYYSPPGSGNAASNTSTSSTTRYKYDIVNPA